MMRNVLCKTVPVQKSRGHTAVGGAAYRAGENILARGVGADGGDKWFRYSPKAIVVREAFIMTPEQGAPDYATDRGELWNHVEEMETHKNARLGRDLNLGFAYELSHAEQRALVVEFAQREVVDKGFIADISIHNYGRTLPAMGASEAQLAEVRGWAGRNVPFLSKDEAQGREDEHVMEMANRDGVVTGYKLYQPHAHIRMTPRPCVDGEFAKDKKAGREFNKAETAKNWRYDWPKLQNEYLERAGSDVRVTSTSAEEDAFPETRFRGTGQSNEMHNLSQRAEAMPAEQREKHDEAKEKIEKYDEFKQVRDAAVLQAANLAAADQAEGERAARDRETVRTTVWWRNMSERFHTWRDDFAEKAQEWRARFAMQETRMKAVIGWQAHNQEPPPDAVPPPHHEPSEPER